MVYTESEVLQSVLEDSGSDEETLSLLLQHRQTRDHARAREGLEEPGGELLVHIRD